jgi:hypothetical protein
MNPQDPMSGGIILRSGHGIRQHRSLRRGPIAAREKLRAGGSRVETVFPDRDAEHLFGANTMDQSLRLEAARAGHEHGRAPAELSPDFWQ